MDCKRKNYKPNERNNEKAVRKWNWLCEIKNKFYDKRGEAKRKVTSLEFYFFYY